VDLLTISAEEVTELLPMKDCISVMGEALINLARRLSSAPLREVIWTSEKSGLLASMPAMDNGLGRFGVKVLSVFPGNHKLGIDSHQGIVVLFDAKQGQPLAIVNAGEITGIRTAAVSAIATRELAREDASDLVIIGCGFQAIKHLEAMCLVRPITRVRAWDLYPSAAESFAEKALSQFGLDVEVQTGEKALVEGADIICTLTPSNEPVLFGQDLTPGVHINAVGSCSPVARELDSEAVIKSRLFVDLIESTLAEAGDILIPIAEGKITKDHIVGEVGQICNGEITGRRSANDITMFEALGLAVEDLAASSYIYEKAITTVRGTMIKL
jgi:alanine dehydrogenase